MKIKKETAEGAENQAALVSALARGLRLLTLFTPQTLKLTFTEMCQRSELARTTVHRLLGTLVAMEYILFDEETRSYFPGLKVMSLGFSALFSIKLSQQLNETVNLAGRDGTDLVYFERIQVKQIINIDLHLGARLPLYNTALGRCLICFFPPAEREGLISSMDSTLRTANAHGQLYQNIEFGHHHGYTLSDEDFALGLRSVAVPVWNCNHRIAAALNVSVPTVRVSVERLQQSMVPQLFETARQISLSLGASKEWIEGGWRREIIARELP